MSVVSISGCFEEGEGCSIQTGESGDAVLSEQETEEGDASGDHLPVSSAQQRKEESAQNEAQRQRRVALLNNVAKEMMIQSRQDHEDTMERFDRMLEAEERRFSVQGERDTQNREALVKAFEKATRETVDVMKAAVDMLGSIAQIFREGRAHGRVGEIPATATSPPYAASTPSVTRRQLHLDCDCSYNRGTLPSDMEYPVLAEESMPESQPLLSVPESHNPTSVPDTQTLPSVPESQSVLAPAPCSSGSVAASRRGKKRSCTGKQRVYFEP
ncbi:uncharacterized protein LOC132575704 [Heteronotia binoei]|uniref:uncharacterized protein LOC132575704 n=1 Tax=Heteronotia binoei TaxID=13085 RepID=UPI0029309FCE|nr:uncharacterized protein LOC132575704 [Heteronotia binoei]